MDNGFTNSATDRTNNLPFKCGEFFLRLQCVRGRNVVFFSLHVRHTERVADGNDFPVASIVFSSWFLRVICSALIYGSPHARTLVPWNTMLRNVKYQAITWLFAYQIPISLLKKTRLKNSIDRETFLDELWVSIVSTMTRRKAADIAEELDINAKQSAKLGVQMTCK